MNDKEAKIIEAVFGILSKDCNPYEEWIAVDAVENKIELEQDERFCISLLLRRMEDAGWVNVRGRYNWEVQVTMQGQNEYSQWAALAYEPACDRQYNEFYSTTP